MPLVPKKRVVPKRPNILKVFLAILEVTIAAFIVAEALALLH
jgi:hypothetical protein